ncbi:MAG: TonB-dependent receptor [Bacteroidia bacterium]
MRIVPYLVLLLTWVLAQEERELPRGTEKPKLEPPQSIVLQGTVRDATTNEPLPGAYVRVKGTISGTISGPDGSFRIPVMGRFPLVIEVSYVGYETTEITVTSTSPIQVSMKQGSLTLKEVVISTSRVPETVLEAPVTVTRLGIREIQAAPAANIFQQIAVMKNVDFYYHSINFPVINTRGFGWRGNPRFIQRIDGIELTVPFLGFSLSMLGSPPEIDMDRMELIAGPASALYGPNAFNGMLDMHSRSPRQYPGLSATLRAGVNHIASEISPRPYFQVSARYAQTLFNRLSFKVCSEYFRATDWLATDYKDQGKYDGADPQYAIPGPDNPGYDGVNLYGDEIRTFNANIAPLFGIQERFYVSRTGYRDQDIVNPEVFFHKHLAQLNYAITDELEISWRSFLSNGTTVYQGTNRHVLRDVLLHQHKLELRSKRLLLRTYGSWENAGRAYDSRFTAIYLNQRVKPDPVWFILYHDEYTRTRSHQAARIYADTVIHPSSTYQMLAQGLGLPLGPFRRRLEPGTPEFRQEVESINGGYLRINREAGFYDRCAFYHTEAQYDLSDFTRRWVELLVGGNVRIFRINTRGTLMADFDGPYFLHEYGGFIQTNRWLFNRRLRVLGSIRYDKSQFFEGRFTPRMAVLYALGKERQHSLRFSYQTGFRIPSLQEQLIALDIGFRVITLGGTSRSMRLFGLDKVMLDPPSVQAYRRAAANIQDTATLRQLAQQYLVRVKLDPLRPEYTQQFEIGGRLQLLRGLYIDAEYARASYRDFVLHRRVVSSEPIYESGTNRPKDLTNVDPSTQEGLRNLRDGRYYEYIVATNYPSEVYADYASIGMEYAITPKILWMASYSYAALSLVRAANPSLLPTFNTPRHKVGSSLYFTGFGNWGWAINYRWIDAFNMDGLILGPVPAAQWVDLQVSYTIPAWKTQIRIGGQNLLNLQYVQLPGGPRVGALYYFQIIYDSFLR